MTDLTILNSENGEIIPPEWGFVQISELVSEFRGGAPLKPTDFVKSGTKVLPKGAVGRGGWLRIDDSVQHCTNRYAAAHENNQVDETFTIVVLRDLVPSGPSIGLMVEIEKSSNFVLAQGVYGFKLNSKAVPSYLTQLSNTRWYRHLMNSIMVGSTQVHVTNTAFKLAKIPLPPLPEQRAIAAALADADGLIAAVEGMIAKKRDLKQAAMQHLLTGKTRLPGFSGQWEVKRLGDVAPLQRGFDLPTTQLESGPYPVVYSNGILNSHKTFQVRGPGIVTGRSGTIGKVTYVEEDFWPHNTALWVTSFKGNDPKFIFFLYTSLDFERFATGSGVPTLNRNDVHAHRVSVPTDPAEQTAIAEVLSDMDADLAALDAQAAKARAVKQGMMQELLTGRVRLV
jgi:type I restriction enzyme S subunit